MCGKKQSGKNTFATLINNEFTSLGYSVVEDMLAGELKRRSEKDFSSFAYVLNNELEKLRVASSSMYNTTSAYHNGGEHQRYIDSLIESLKIKAENWYETKTPLTRSLLECYGTDIIRNRISDTYWIDDIKEKITFDYYGKYDVVILTDVRFPNEIESFYEGVISEWFDVISIKVERPIYELKDYNHISNTSLDDFKEFCYIECNEKGINELKIDAKLIVEDIINSENDK